MKVREFASDPSAATTDMPTTSHRAGLHPHPPVESARRDELDDGVESGVADDLLTELKRLRMENAHLKEAKRFMARKCALIC